MAIAHVVVSHPQGSANNHNTNGSFSSMQFSRGRGQSSRGRFGSRSNRGGRFHWNRNKIICQLCGYTGHVATQCYYRFDRSFSGSTQFHNSRGGGSSVQGNLAHAKIPDIEKCLDIVATLQARKGTCEAKIPDIEKCLDIVATLQARKGTCEAIIADFEFSEGISGARIEDTDSVWLRANVMLEYSCDEASTLLQKNLENAKASLQVLVPDLQLLRDQVTITQVIN
ncbi:hypothetical protein DH2020_004343 [Rehmannia glutinosa]|uniref:CCHC-type domain-containing protein n=1 Tax=Rehmannia glutinosa TaxID=99300 RepID=A0ABR0XP90_REHGL